MLQNFVNYSTIKQEHTFDDDRKPEDIKYFWRY